MIEYMLEHENPVHVSGTTEPKLHNILTQEIMSEDIRNNMLKVTDIGKELYTSFRRERYIEKSKRLSDTIHRTKLKTCKMLHIETTTKKERRMIRRKS